MHINDFPNTEKPLAEKEEIYIRLFDILTMDNLRLENEVERLKNGSNTDYRSARLQGLKGLRRICYAYAFYGCGGFLKAILRKLHIYKG